MAFVVLVFLKRPRLNWTYWPTNRGAVPTESRDRDNTDPRLRGGEGGERRGEDTREESRGEKRCRRREAKTRRKRRQEGEKEAEEERKEV